MNAVGSLLDDIENLVSVKTDAVVDGKKQFFGTRVERGGRYKNAACAAQGVQRTVKFTDFFFGHLNIPTAFGLHHDVFDKAEFFHGIDDNVYATVVTAADHVAEQDVTAGNELIFFEHVGDKPFKERTTHIT